MSETPKIPKLAGFKEAQEIMGWPKGQLSNYIQRGTFPKPIQKLHSGPVWIEETILEYKRQRDVRLAARKTKGV